MHEIVPGLFLCSWQQALDAATTPFFVVNCTRDLPMLSEEGVRVPVDDNGEPESSGALASALPAVVAEIRNRLAAGERVVVHCMAGRQRSAAVAAAFVLAEGIEASVSAAIAYVKARKADAFFPGANFRDALDLFSLTARIPLLSVLDMGRELVRAHQDGQPQPAQQDHR